MSASDPLDDGIAKLTKIYNAAPVAQKAQIKAQIDTLIGFKDIGLAAKAQKIAWDFFTKPDTDAWNEQRQKGMLALGERVFEQDFARVFDSLTLAVSGLELKVSNMERISGYIAASSMTLPPTEAKAMQREALVDWCKQNGIDPKLLDPPYQTDAYRKRDVASEMLASAGAGGLGMAKAQKGLTFQLVKMGENKTKVKLRFSDVYYPAEVEAFYKIIWQAVDKQIFVDKTIEGGVEKRG